MSAVDALIEDIKLIRKNLEALHNEVAGLSKRAREQGKHLSRAELDEVLDKVKKETSFYIPFKEVAEGIQPHLATPAKLDATILNGLQQLERIISQIPRSVPVEGQVWGFTNWKVGALSVGTPLLLLLLLLWFPKLFSRVPKAELEHVQAQARLEGERAERLVVAGKQALDIARFYDKQIKAYVKKNPKAAVSFPKYAMPQKSPRPQ